MRRTDVQAYFHGLTNGSEGCTNTCESSVSSRPPAENLLDLLENGWVKSIGLEIACISCLYKFNMHSVRRCCMWSK